METPTTPPNHYERPPQPVFMPGPGGPADQAESEGGEGGEQAKRTSGKAKRSAPKWHGDPEAEAAHALAWTAAKAAQLKLLSERQLPLLDSLDEARDCLALVARSMLTGALDSRVGRDAAQALKILADVHQASRVEKRLAELEKRVGIGKAGSAGVGKADKAEQA